MLKLFTTYSPPEHEAGTEHDTKADASYQETGDLQVPSSL